MTANDPMTGADLRSYLRRSAATNFIFNFLINGALAWWLLSGNDVLTAWGEAAYGPDLLVTGFLLAAIVAAIGIEIHRRKGLRGEMEPIPIRSGIVASASQHNALVICSVIGLIGAMLSALVVVVIATATSSLSVPAYAGLKGLWAGLLAAALVGSTTAIGLARGAAERAEA